MRKIRSFSVLLLILLLWNCCNCYAVPTADSCMTLDAKIALAGSNQLLPTAQAVVLYAPDCDTLVYSWRADSPLDPSGMNKIMTALLALECGNLNSIVTVTSTALNSVEMGAMSAGLKAGETLTLRDLLYLMMVGSANDAAAVIAEHISGSQAAFIKLMNQRAQELGCTNTVFLNPTGLSADGQHSTARDLAKITAFALKDQQFVELFSTVEYTVPASNMSTERKVITTNYMMSDASVRDQLDSRVTGGKTGALSTTDRSLISTAEKDGQQYLAVVMSAKGSMNSSGTSVRSFGNFSETKLLLDHAFSQYGQCQLLSANKVMAQFTVHDGENDLAVSSRQSVCALMPKDMQADKIVFRCIQTNENISAPVSAGNIVGIVQLWYDNICVAQGDLIAMHDVRKMGTSAVPIQPHGSVEVNGLNTLTTVCLIVLSCVVLGVFSVPVVLRMIHVTRYRARRKSKQRSL